MAKGKASASVSKDDVQLLNRDINYIHPVGKLLARQDKDHAGTPFFIALAAILFLSVGAILWGKKRQKDQQDIAGLRMKRATRMARRRLKKAAAFLGSGDSNRFYEEIYRAIWGCLSDKYSIPLSQLSRDTVSACIVEKQVPQSQQQSIMKVLQDVDFARFAPGDAQAQKQSIYDEALQMIANI